MSDTPDRRTFLKTGAAASAAASLSFVPTLVHAGGNTGTLKIGLIGCGGRGSGAARQALLADRDVKLWAVGDAFRDRTKECLTALRQSPNLEPKVDVPKERQFVGFDAYSQVINSGVDVVTIGQYLQPTKNHLPVNRFIHPDEFAEYREIGYGLGLDYVESGPLVRSSYHSEKHVIEGWGRNKWMEEQGNKE